MRQSWRRDGARGLRRSPALDPATEALIRDEVARRVEAIEARDPAAFPVRRDPGGDLKAELARSSES
jgi:hypothetical protein